MRPLAVLFDLDGTLVDTVELIVRSAKHAFSLHPGPGPSDSEWVAGIGTPLVTQFRPWARSDAELTALLEAYRGYQRQHHDALTRCFDDVVDTVRGIRARGHPIGIVTSKIEELARRSLEWVQLDREIDVLVGADATTSHKPNPEPVLHALSLLGYEPDEAIFVGDSPHDIAAGNAAGVISVAVLWGPFSRETLERASPRYVISRIGELPAVLDIVAGTSVS